MPEIERHHDPLSELLVDAGEIDRERIARALKGTLGLDSDTARVVVHPGFGALNSRQKIDAYLLVRKVAVLLGIADDEWAAPADAVRDTGMPEGTVRPILAALVQEHRVSRKDSRYALSPAQIGAAIDELLGEASTRTTRARKPRRGSSSQRGLGGSPATIEASAGTESRARPTSHRRGQAEGPMSLVSGLIDAGFFAEPRKLSDVQRELKDNTGHRIESTTLSPVMTRLLRRGVLTRAAKDGVYEYSAR